MLKLLLTIHLAVKKFKEDDSKSSKFTEISYGLGGKVFVQQAFAEKFSVNAGVGAGVEFKSAKQTFSFSRENRRTGETDLSSAQLAAKRVTQPFGLVSVGADYTISDGVAVGLEYAVKFNDKKRLQNQQENNK